jgi:hypothetical protein
MSHELLAGKYDDMPVLKFKEIDGVMTAHLSAGCASLLNLTKEEVESILQGYPPFYTATIPLSDTAHVVSPISGPEDITRGGWIIGIGICYNRFPLFTHNMDLLTTAEEDLVWERPYP